MPQSMFITGFLCIQLHKCAGKCPVPCRKHRCDNTCLEVCLRFKEDKGLVETIPPEGDYMGMKHVKQIICQINVEEGERIVFSTEMQKKSSGHGLMQERHLLITTDRIINVKGHSF